MTALSPDPSMLTHRARDLVNAGRMSAARPLIAALRRIAPGTIDTFELDARVLHHDGRGAEAASLLVDALAAYPDAPALLLCRAEMRMQNGEFLGGADDAAAAVIADPANVPAKAMLGVALIQLGRFDEAVLCLHEAVSAWPRQPNFREALAMALERCGRGQEALATLEHGITLTPASVSLRVAAIMTAMRGRDPANALRLAEAARKAGVADARVFGLLGHAKSLLGDDAGAVAAYEEALKLAPEDPYVRYLVAASGALPSAPRAPAAYVQAVFDGYASHFEAHLISLGYRVPGLIRAALLEHVPALRPIDHQADRRADRRADRGEDAGADRIGPVLDLGCGTGLVGVVLSDLPITGLVGVDISAKMLREARAKQIYAELRQQDIEAALRGPRSGGPDAAPPQRSDGSSDGAPAERPAENAAESWALILAADALCYFGDLAPVLRGAFAALRPGGLFVFSVEEWLEPAMTAVRAVVPQDHAVPGGRPPGAGPFDEGGGAVAETIARPAIPNPAHATPANADQASPEPEWRLGALGRYAHRADALAALAAATGFRVLARRREVMRHDQGMPVDGLIVVLGRAA